MVTAWIIQLAACQENMLEAYLMDMQLCLSSILNHQLSADIAVDMLSHKERLKHARQTYYRADT
jgi:hypothetical protein